VKVSIGWHAAAFGRWDFTAYDRMARFEPLVGFA
jgi:hypothetical protein